MKNNSLVIGQLEKASGKILETYAKSVRTLIRGRSGVYALYRNENLYYVGLASNLMSRLKAHLRDRHNGKWNRFSVYLTVHDEHMKELESLLLRITSPSGNRQTGRFGASKNLTKELARAIKDEDDARRASLLGGKVQRQRVKRNARRTRGSASLSGAFDRSRKLKGTYKQRNFHATLLQDGQIRFNGRRFESPSAAGKVARGGRKTNGWAFWKYKDSKTKLWVPLKRLKH